MNRRAFLTALAALPFCGWLKPADAVKVLRAPDGSVVTDRAAGISMRFIRNWNPVIAPRIYRPYRVDVLFGHGTISRRLTASERNFDPRRLPA